MGIKPERLDEALERARRTAADDHNEALRISHDTAESSAYRVALSAIQSREVEALYAIARALPRELSPTRKLVEEARRSIARRQPDASTLLNIARSVLASTLEII